MITYLRDEDISFDEYHEFLKRTDLGSQYPKERFKERLTKSLKNRSIGITARNRDGLLVGIAFALTDFAYFLFLTDLGVDRSYVKKGIGTELMKRIQTESGGEDDITVVTISNEEAYNFYKKSKLKNHECLFWKCCKQWTEHTVK
ncbi:acetyltransferase, GNAT family [Verrucomicrobiia bacterium DG1235]|nr:acetyltransferase, GNAT family [Verrucomicrobiae bacterium DG1235]